MQSDPGAGGQRITLAALRSVEFKFTQALNWSRNEHSLSLATLMRLPSTQGGLGNEMTCSNQKQVHLKHFLQPETQNCSHLANQTRMQVQNGGKRKAGKECLHGTFPTHPKMLLEAENEAIAQEIFPILITRRGDPYHSLPDRDKRGQGLKW